MEGTPQEPERQPRDYRYYTENAYHLSADDARDESIDVADLIGAKGVKREPNKEDWYDWEHMDQEPNLKPNPLTVETALEFLQDHETYEEYWETGAINILHMLARRQGPAAADSFRFTVDQLMEPVRTVAVNCLFMEEPREAVARRLETSVETIDFLIEIALSHLEQLVEFHPARVRPPSLLIDPRYDHPSLGLYPSGLYPSLDV